MSFMITTDGTPGITQVPNEILIEYLLKAGGEYVKIYLYLLMACQNPGITGPVSVEALADVFDLTERDIVRMLRYWQREGLLSLYEDNMSGISGITLHNPDHTGVYAESAPSFIETGAPHLKVVSREDEPVSRSMTDEPADSLPERTEYTALQIDALTNDDEMGRTLSKVEQLLKAPISSAHMQLLMYMVCDLAMSFDLIVYLYETAVSRGKTNPRYIEAVAIDWSKKGIRTIEQAKNEAKDFGAKYRPVKEALGIHRDLAPVEKELIDKWDAYGFSEEIITEACKRTVMQTGDTNLNYVSRILEGWHKQNVKTKDDIKKVDEAFHKAGKAKARAGVAKKTASRNSFRNFNQRDYSDEDYEAMELQFLKQRKGTQ